MERKPKPYHEACEDMKKPIDGTVVSDIFDIADKFLAEQQLETDRAKQAQQDYLWQQATESEHKS